MIRSFSPISEYSIDWSPEITLEIVALSKTVFFFACHSDIIGINRFADDVGIESAVGVWKQRVGFAKSACQQIHAFGLGHRPQDVLRGFFRDIP